jgi:hypothetical protein
MHVHAQRQGQSFRQLQESVERLTQDGAPQGGEHAHTPSDHH